MEPRHHRRQQVDYAIARAFVDIRNPLTVATVTAQLLRRHIEQGHILEAHQCLSALARIEESGRNLKASLEALEDLIAAERSRHL